MCTRGPFMNGRRSHKSWETWPPLYEANGDGGHNLWMIHILLLSRLYTNVNALSSLSWCVGRVASRRQMFCDWRPLDIEITTILPVRGNEDYLLTAYKVNDKKHEDNNRKYQHRCQSDSKQTNVDFSIDTHWTDPTDSRPDGFFFCSSVFLVYSSRLSAVD